MVSPEPGELKGKAMETKHTPGDWAIRSKINGSNPIDYGTEKQCTGTAYGATEAEVVANARLQTAAPDLLAALRECITDEGSHALAYDYDGGKADRRLRAINEIARAAIAKATK